MYGSDRLIDFTEAVQSFVQVVHWLEYDSQAFYL